LQIEIPLEQYVVEEVEKQAQDDRIWKIQPDYQFLYTPQLDLNDGLSPPEKWKHT
jgi:hypothetical protein